MRRRVLIVLAALVLAGLSAMSVLVYARGVDRRAVAGRDGVWVLLADGRIPAGTTGAQIRQKKLAERVLMPAETVPTGTLTSMDSALDKLRLSADLQPQQLLMRGLFTGVDAAAGAGVPDGKLAVSIEVTMAPGVAEKVAAGDEVTVFVTYPKDLPPSGQKTRILLPRASVISISTGPASDVAPSPSPSKTSSTRTTSKTYPATLAVNQQEAVRLVHAAQTGLIYLGLVGAGTDVTPSSAVDYDSLWP